MKTLFTFILFIFIASFGISQTTIAIQDFDSGTPTWNYTPYPNPYNVSNDIWDDVTSNNAPSGTTGAFWGIRDLDNNNGGGAFEHTLTLDGVDISGHNSVTVSFDYYTKAFDSGDYLKYEIFQGNSGSEVSQGKVTLNNNTNAWTSVSINIPDVENSVYIKIIAYQNGGKDYAGIDNFKVIGTAASSNSHLSDIVKKAGWTEPQNIDYTQYSAASGLTLSNSIEVAKFTIRDGGGSMDIDNVSTILTSISIEVLNVENIAALAIFYSNNNLQVPLNKREVTNFTSSTVVFSNIDATANDDLGSGNPSDVERDFTIQATFKNKVIDNSHIRFKIVSVTADPNGSLFKNTSGGGAITDITGDNNKLIVTATKLKYADKPPTSVYINTDFSIKVEATDDNGNRDLDATNAVTLAKYNSMQANTPGALTSASGLTQNLSNGVYLWTDVQYDYVATFKIDAQANFDSISSGDIDCENPPAGPTGLVITEVCGDYADGDNGNDNGFVEIYNPTSQTIDLTNLQVRYYNSNPNAATATVNLSGTLASGEYIIITQDEQAFDYTYSPITSDYYNGNFYFNGDDDGIDLYDASAKGTVISQFNIVGTGSPWTWNAGDDMELKSYSSDGSVKTNWATDNQPSAQPGTPRGDNSTLPIKLLSFKAKQIKESIVINWQTATETNNDYFTIERAIDAEHFEVIGTIRGAGNSNIIKEYQFEDENTSDANVLYYRLKQTDYDGTFTYSKIISVQANQKELSLLNAYVEGDVLTISLASPIDDAINMEIYDMNGKLVVDKTMDMQKGQNDFSISVANLPQAIYFVRLSNAKFIKTQKIFIR
jgi:hypothetical protein